MNVQRISGSSFNTPIGHRHVTEEENMSNLKQRQKFKTNYSFSKLNYQQSDDHDISTQVNEHGIVNQSHHAFHRSYIGNDYSGNELHQPLDQIDESIIGKLKLSNQVRAHHLNQLKKDQKNISALKKMARKSENKRLQYQLNQPTFDINMAKQVYDKDSMMNYNKKHQYPNVGHQS